MEKKSKEVSLLKKEKEQLKKWKDVLSEKKDKKLKEVPLDDMLTR